MEEILSWNQKMDVEKTPPVWSFGLPKMVFFSGPCQSTSSSLEVLGLYEAHKSCWRGCYAGKPCWTDLGLTGWLDLPGSLMRLASQFLYQRVLTEVG